MFDSSLLTPPVIPTRTPRSGDPRIWELLSTDYADCDIVLVGFPCDTGVTRNGGRAGAASAPDGIRTFLYNMCPDARNVETSARTFSGVYDAGNLVVTNQLEADQRCLGAFVASVLDDGKIAIVIGGGHETAYGHFLGYKQSGKDVSVVNLDAHPDVRELIDGSGHSGSPFRQMMENDVISCDYAVLGLQPSAVSASHVEYMSDNGVEFSFREDFSTQDYSRQLRSSKTKTVMASFDIDVCDITVAPGVSAPAINGLTASDLLESMFEAGRSPNVHSMDIVEVNPKFDIDNRTSRLAAMGIWSFINGIGQRTSR